MRGRCWCGCWCRVLVHEWVLERMLVVLEQATGPSHAGAQAGVELDMVLAQQEGLDAGPGAVVFARAGQAAMQRSNAG